MALNSLCGSLQGAGGSEATVIRYVMPDDGDYVLEQDAAYTLPIQGSGPIDIAADASVLWMVVDKQVRLRAGPQLPFVTCTSSHVVCRASAHPCRRVLILPRRN